MADDVYVTALEDILMSHIPVSYTTKRGKRAQHIPGASLRNNIDVAHHRFLKR